MKHKQNSPWLPTFYAPRLFDVTADFFKRNHIQYLCCDLDNTLAPYDEMKPRPEVKRWIQSMIDAGLTFLIISNNDESRVQPFAAKLGVDYLAKTGKPFKDKLLMFLKQKGYAKDKVMVIGDQLLTDVWLANRLGMKSLFTEKLVSYDHWPTKPNRFIESFLKKRYQRQHRLNLWRNQE